MYHTQFFIIWQVHFFPTFFRFDLYTFLTLGGNTKSSKYCNTLLFPFKRKKLQVGNKSESECNIKKMLTMTGMSRIEKDKLNKILKNPKTKMVLHWTLNSIIVQTFSEFLGKFKAQCSYLFL